MLTGVDGPDARRRAGRAALAVVALMAILAGCARPQHILQSGTLGTNAQIGQMLLRAVHVQAPEQPFYPQGASPQVWLTIVNESREPDTLLSVTTPQADRVDIFWDQDCDGTPALVTQLPLASADPVPDPASPAAAPFADYHLRLVNLHQQVPAGTTIPLTFTFARAGTLRTAAYVQPSNAIRPEPSQRCQHTPPP